MKTCGNYLVRVVLFALVVLVFQAETNPLFAEERWISAAYVKDGAIYTGKKNSKLVVRSGPGTTYDKIDTIANGQKVNTYETRNGWVRISLPDVSGALGSIFAPEDTPSAPVKPVATASTAAPAATAEQQWVDGKYVKEGMVNTGNPAANLAVRSGPGKTFTTVKTVPHGEKVSVYETKNGWVRISPDQKPVSAAAVAKKSNVPKVKPAYILNFSALLLLFLRKK